MDYDGIGSPQSTGYCHGGLYGDSHLNDQPAGPANDQRSVDPGHEPGRSAGVSGSRPDDNAAGHGRRLAAGRPEGIRALYFICVAGSYSDRIYVSIGGYNLPLTIVDGILLLS